MLKKTKKPMFDNDFDTRSLALATDSASIEQVEMHHSESYLTKPLTAGANNHQRILSLDDINKALIELNQKLKDKMVTSEAPRSKGNNTAICYNKLQEVVDRAATMISVKSVDGRYLYMNSAFQDTFGILCSLGDIHSDFDLFPERTAITLSDFYRRSVLSNKPIEIQFSCAISGKERNFRIRSQIIKKFIDNCDVVVSELNELTYLHDPVQRLEIAAKVFLQNDEASLIADEDGLIVAANKQLKSLTCFEYDELIGTKVVNLIGDSCNKQFFKDIWQHALNNGYWQGELWSVFKDGRTLPLYTTIEVLIDEQHDGNQYVISFADLTSVCRSQRRVEFLATHDPLTSLPNRSLFFERLQRSIEQCRQANTSFMLLYLDLDNFKTVNDTLGHVVGDKLLVIIGDLLNSVVGTDDAIARIGGDEFIILVNNSNIEQVLELANRILLTLKEPSFIDKKPLYISASIGIATFPQDGNDHTALLKSADMAMYEAKKQGRNQFCCFHNGLKDELHKRAQIEGALKDAIRYKNMRLVFQPKFAASNECNGVEVLLRWRDPQLGDISPADFIPIAESCGVIIELTRYVNSMLFSYIKELKQRNIQLPTFAVNISPLCIKLDNFVDELFLMMDNAGIEPELIKIEITENSLLDNSQSVLNNLELLNERGMEVSIDDFGTGYSSLHYLKKMSINEIKIDRAFVGGLGENSDDESICLAILSLAKAFDLRVVAEGVENDRQRQWLINNGCDSLQGYLLSKPLEMKKFNEFILQMPLNN